MRSSLTFPKNENNIIYFESVLPSKSTIMGLFVFLYVFSTRTALAVGEVVVSGSDVVVTSGEGVVSVHE